MSTLTFSGGLPAGRGQRKRNEIAPRRHKPRRDEDAGDTGADIGGEPDAPALHDRARQQAGDDADQCEERDFGDCEIHGG